MSKPVIEGKPTLTPGMCFLCELSNPVKYVDTLRDYASIVKDKLDGRKYVCEECIDELAEALGHVKPKVADKLKADLEGKTAEVAKLEERVKELEVYEAAITKAVAAKAAPKAPSKKA